MEICIDINKYNDSVHAIEKANERSINNSGNFNMTFSNSESNMITAYGEAILELRSTLQVYNERLTGDIAKLYVVRDEVEALDKNL